MERHIESFLNRTSLLLATIATVLLLSIFLRTTTTPPPTTCIHHTSPLHFPKSTCSPSLRHRPSTTLSTKNRRLWSTASWISSVNSFSLIFHPLFSPPISVLSNSSRSLLLFAGAGQEVMALQRIGVEDLTGVDLVDSPPLVSRADLFNLPFFDGVFDFAFSTQFDIVLFPTRFVAEMERTVRVGGHCVLVIDGETTENEVREIVRLFPRGKMFGRAVDVALNGSNMKRILLQNLRVLHEAPMHVIESEVSFQTLNVEEARVDSATDLLSLFCMARTFRISDGLLMGLAKLDTAGILAKKWTKLVKVKLTTSMTKKQILGIWYILRMSPMLSVVDVHITGRPYTDDDNVIENWGQHSFDSINMSEGDFWAFQSKFQSPMLQQVEIVRIFILKDVQDSDISFATYLLQQCSGLRYFRVLPCSTVYNHSVIDTVRRQILNSKKASPYVHITVKDPSLCGVLIDE